MSGHGEPAAARGFGERHDKGARGRGELPNMERNADFFERRLGG